MSPPEALKCRLSVSDERFARSAGAQFAGDWRCHLRWRRRVASGQQVRRSKPRATREDPPPRIRRLAKKATAGAPRRRKTAAADPATSALANSETRLASSARYLHVVEIQKADPSDFARRVRPGENACRQLLDNACIDL